MFLWLRQRPILDAKADLLAARLCSQREDRGRYGGKVKSQVLHRRSNPGSAGLLDEVQIFVWRASCEFRLERVSAGNWCVRCRSRDDVAELAHKRRQQSTGLDSLDAEDFAYARVIELAFPTQQNFHLAKTLFGRS